MLKRVLIASADAHSRDEIAKNLARWGYGVLAVGDDTGAWSALQKADAPCILLLDAALPGVGSLELCRRVRDLRGDDAFILVMTRDETKADYIDALEAGADGAIEKPLHLRELRIRLASAMRGRRVALSDVPAPESPLSAKDPAAESLVGRVIARKYQITRLIGKGGMGTVWEGIHLSLGMRVAIKFIQVDYAKHPIARARFELEAKAAARLRTKYAVKVFDFGVTSGGLSYLVMEYLEGPSLIKRVQESGPLSFAETVTLVAQASHALGEAHSHGIIHRDVKPENVLMVTDPDGDHAQGAVVAKLIDFGVVKMLARPGSVRAPAVCTDGGIVVGTPNFMAPEQLRGDADPDVAADLWAVAACAFTAITGRIPFEGSTLSEVLRRVCHGVLPIPSKVNANVPPEFDAWFAKACDRDPEKRFRSAKELATALAAAHSAYADAALEMTPSLSTFVAQPPCSNVIELAPLRRRIFELDEPMCVTFG